MLQKLRQNARLRVQVAFAALTNGYITGFLRGTIYKGPGKQFCVPGLNCYSCPGALGSCPLGALQAVIGSRDYQFSLYVVGFLAAAGAAGGRFVCGFLCPFGLVQDLLYRIPSPKRQIPAARRIGYLRYALLALFVVLLPMAAVNIVGQGDPWFCKWVCPAGTLMGGVPLMLSSASLRAAAGGLFGWKSLLLAAAVAGAVFFYRPFCRLVCPLGAIYGFFNPVSLYRYRLDKEKCTDCGVCRRVCKLGIDPRKTPNSPDCIRCGECLRHCPHGALTTTAARGCGHKRSPRGCASCRGCETGKDR